VFVQMGVADLGMLVRDGRRGQGVGSALMEACLGWCRGIGAHKVTLTVFPHNAAGLALYRKFGFVEEGRLVRHYRRRSGQLWDAIAMGLVLDEDRPGSPYPDADVL
jgi:RimJ/RimL family protein N-acetyltransferase